jgi:hypothetical protein
MEVHFSVDEIELKDGTIYTPSDGTRSFRLKRVEGVAITDISPSDGTRYFGVNRGPFGVRTFDGTNGQKYVLLSGIGNDVSIDPSDDKHAVFVSDAYGSSFVEIVTSIDDSAAPTNRPAFEAAFGGSSPNIIFIWGPPAYLSYSDDMGAVVQDKSGNLAALGCAGFIGIAGGSS